ncbi:hypothetical protein ABPG72_021939 [Tetrahymena utriculariae]
MILLAFKDLLFLNIQRFHSYQGPTNKDNQKWTFNRNPAISDFTDSKNDDQKRAISLSGFFENELGICRNYTLLEIMYICVYDFLILQFHVVENTNQLTNNDNFKRSKVIRCLKKHLFDGMKVMIIVR